MSKSGNSRFAARVVHGAVRLRDRVGTVLDRAQLGPSRETDLRGFMPRR